MRWSGSALGTAARGSPGSPGAEIHDPQSIDNADPAAVANAAKQLKARYSGRAFVIASVNKPASEKLETLLTGEGDVYVIGRDLEIPMKHTLDDASTVGQDRLLDALGAYAKLNEACIVVDAGTAVTVDFVDGEGTFHGGVIAPGLRMMLRAMHQQTSGLPELAYELPKPDRGVFGKDTARDAAGRDERAHRAGAIHRGEVRRTLSGVPTGDRDRR